VTSELEQQTALDLDDPSIIPDRFAHPRGESTPGPSVPAVVDDDRRPARPVRSAIAENAAMLIVVLVAMLVVALVMSFASR
jgi:hypothetical protein